MRAYTFGDDTSAASRLALVADAYEPVSRPFLEAHTPAGSRVVVDVGCGPGFSTALLAETSRAATLVAADTSPEFLRLAKERVPGVVAVEADVRSLPLGERTADAVYARLVLAHLPDPLATAEAWRATLTSRGVLLVEDLEGIDAPDGPLSAYEEISAAVVRRGGGVMYGGERLRSLGGTTVAVTVPASVAAKIYLFNVHRWINDPPEGVAATELTELQSALEDEMARTDGDTVSWVVRQAAVRPD